MRRGCGAGVARVQRGCSCALPCRQLREDLVPTARLELAQLSPLPPQDSVSTNFTTSAENKYAEKIIPDGVRSGAPDDCEF